VRASQIRCLAKTHPEDRYPAGIFVEGATDAAPATAPAKAGEDDDFFSSWDKPAAAAKPAATAPATPAAPPSIGRGAAAAPAPRTLTSSAALRAAGSTSGAGTAKPKLGASRLSSAPAAGAGAGGAAAGPAKKKLGGLGAKKAAPVDFAEAERKAQAEEERIRQLGYDREKEEEEVRKAAEAARLASITVKPAAASSSSPAGAASAPSAPVVKKPLGNDQDMARLGMGMKRLGFGAVPQAPAKQYYEETTTAAQDRFGTQKAISSDMYFERGTYDKAAASEAQERLRGFQGATSISSSAYFGRDEEEERALGPLGAEGEGLLGDGTLQNLEVAARDAIQRVMANPDVQSAADSIRAGALQVLDGLRTIV
jgi:ADP-ribosylation factor GTPase-activating protein 2/3